MLDRRPAVGDARGRQLEVLALERERLVVEGALEDLHRLLEHLSVLGVGLGLVGVVERPDRDVLGAEALGLAGHGAPTDAEDRPSAREVVERGEVLGQTERMPLGDDVEHRADPHVLGLGRQPRAHEDAVGHHLVPLVLEVVLGQPVGVVAELVGEDAQVDEALGGVPAVVLREATVLGTGRSGAGVVHLDATEEEHADLHRDLPGVCGRPPTLVPARQSVSFGRRATLAPPDRKASLGGTLAPTSNRRR